MGKIIEICCGSFEDAYIAKEAGADQIELNSSLFLGGLTPSTGLVKLVKDKINIKIIAMLRPRAGGFYYNNFEYKTMLKDIEELLRLDVEGIAFGCLTKNKEIDREKNIQLIDLIHSENKLAVFHRAFDQTKDPYQAIEELIDLGVDRVLTSGQKDKAIEGLDLLSDLENKYGDKIEILVASGVNEGNVKEIYKKTGIDKFHSSCKTWREDPTTIGNISYEYGGKTNRGKYEVASLDKAISFTKAIKNI